MTAPHLKKSIGRSFSRLALLLIPLVFGCFALAPAAALAQISSINSAHVTPRQFNDIPGAIITTVSNYPSLISFEEQNVSQPTGFANRDSWHFSNDNGASSYSFNNSDAFTMTMDVTLTGDPISPRKEAGFVFNNPLNDGGEFIVNTDGHEIVAFGGFLRFYAFPRVFNSGDTVTLGITVFKDSNNKNAIIYMAKTSSFCMVSPALEFDNFEQGVIDGTTIGGYFAINNSPTIPTNSGEGIFENIHIGASDQDFDGVADSDDTCPNTPPCTPVDSHGCSLPSCQFATSITSNFNGTRINSGNYIWFNSVLKPSGLGSTAVTIHFTQQAITSANFSLSVPDASVTFDPGVTMASTTFGSGGVSTTTVPSNPTLKGNTLFSALGYQVPANLPGGIHNVTWSGTISTDTPGVSVNWKWGAAVYTMFDAIDYNNLMVKPVDDKVQNPYLNADHAGTPEAFKSFVIGGATGGGGANYTGGLSGTAAVGPCQP